MAQLTWQEMVDAIRNNPQYADTWEAEVPIDQALYVAFCKVPDGVVVESDIVELANGSELVLDRGPDGKVYGIEFI